MKSTNKIKSPLRYPGGKSRAVKEIWKYIEPLEPETLCSPFFGGGSLEIFCAQKDIKVYGYDHFRPLVDFWRWLLKDPEKLAKSVEKYKPGQFSKESFYELQKTHPLTKDSFKRATEFYVLNRTSYSGSTLSGGMANYKGINPRFTKSSVQRLRDFKVKNLSVKCASFEKSIIKHPDVLLYLDPPYLIKNKLYGNRGDLHKNFQHEKLAEILKNREKWILSYNNSDEVRELYSDFQITTPRWSYSMSKDKKMPKDKKSKELLIFSNDIKI